MLDKIFCSWCWFLDYEICAEILGKYFQEVENFLISHVVKRLGRCIAVSFDAASTGNPATPSRLALQIPPFSAPKSSNFHTSTFFLHCSKASSPAFQAACLWGLATAISILSSPIGTVPSRWTMLIAVNECFFFTAWAMSIIVLRARGG